MESQSITIARQSSFEVPIKLTENSRAIWTFESEDFDVGFSAAFVDAAGGDAVVVVPASRVDSHLLPQQGKYEARKAGTLTLTWDNSYSKLRSKKLQYSVSVDTILGESADAVTGIVRTQYGPGAVIAEREDGFVVVDLVYGRSYLRPEAILSRQTGFYAATSMFQLQRLDRLHSMLTARGLSEEERLWCDDGCLMRHLLTANWNIEKAYNQLTKTLTWRFGAIEAGAMRPQDLHLANMREILRGFPCFVAGYDAERRPVVVFRMDTEGNNLTNQQKLQGMLFAIEQGIRNIHADGPQSVTLFVDFKGFGKRHVNIHLAKDFVTAYAKHYRRLLGSCIIFNSSTLFSVFWTSVQPLLAKLKFSRDRLIWLRGESDEASLKRLGELLGQQTLRSVLDAFPDFDQYMRSGPAGSPVAPRTSPGPAGGAGGGTASQTVRAEDVVPLDQAFAYSSTSSAVEAAPPAVALPIAGSSFNDPFAVQQPVDAPVEASPVVTAAAASASLESQVQAMSIAEPVPAVQSEGDADVAPPKEEAGSVTAAEPAQAASDLADVKL